MTQFIKRGSLMLSPEVRNAIILIIAVSIALKVVTPTLIGNSSYLYSKNVQQKPQFREIADLSYSGHLAGKPISYDNPFPGLFPESFSDDRPSELYPPRPDIVFCGLCTCFTGLYQEQSQEPLYRYSGEFNEEECTLSCQASNTRFVAFSAETQTICGNPSIR